LTASTLPIAGAAAACGATPGAAIGDGEGRGAAGEGAAARNWSRLTSTTPCTFACGRDFFAPPVFW
jgi:hypothetical protein